MNAPRRATSWTICQSSSVIRWIGASRVTPALLTTMSSRSVERDDGVDVDAGSVTSPTAATPPSSAAARSHASALRSLTSTDAPSATSRDAIA